MTSFYWWLQLRVRLGARSPLYEQATVIRASGLFDGVWYNRDTSLVKSWLRDPVIHFIRHGAKNGRDPHPLFDVKYYRRRMPAPQKDTNPLVHYQTEGAFADINPSRWFNSVWYRSLSPEPLGQAITPLLHFWRTGVGEGRSPHPLFDLDWYAARYAGEIAGLNPLAEYIHTGSRRGRVPHRALSGSDRVDASDRSAVLKSIDAALATPEPRAPRHLFLRNFDQDRAERFVAETRQALRENSPPSLPTLVSIIMAARDRAARMKTAIDSVRAQTYANWELLVVDDASTDDTASVVASYAADPRIRYVKGDGRGAAAARNIGLAAAKGELVAYLDTDNSWTPQFLEVMVGFLQSGGLDLAYSGMRVEGGGEIRYRGRAFNFEDLVRVNYIDLNAVMHRRALVDRIGKFDETLRRMIDWDLIIRYTRGGKVGYAPFIGVSYSDQREQGDRISVRESRSWRFVVLNRHLIDWEKLEADAPGRPADLVSIVIPVHGNMTITNDCLESIFAHPSRRPFEIVLVNNKSDPYTSLNLALWEQARSNVRVVRNWTNLNFALGCNIGFAASRGAFVIFLNNDTIVTPGWLDRLADDLGEPVIGAVQPKLLYPDGAVQSIGAVFSNRGTISYPLYRGEPGDAPHVNRRRNLQALHGACLALRAGDFARLRGFDPHFVNGQEDIDLCLRIGQITRKSCLVDPDAVVIHLEGRSRQRSPYLRRNRAVFVERWAGRIVPDDIAIYEADGFTVDSWRVDSEAFDRRGIAAHYPKLRRIGETASGAVAESGPHRPESA